MNKAFNLFAAMMFCALCNAQTGITWNMGMNIASSASGNDHPRIALDRSGNPLVIWSHVSRAMFSRWNGTAFTMPVMLNPVGIDVAGASWMGPDIASHGDTVYVVFKQTPEASDTCHIFCVHSYDGGMTFSAPVQVDNIADSISRFPTVTTDANGNPIVAFMKFDPLFMDARWVVTTSADFGNSFSVDVKASGWSSGTSTVCDCCPGALVSSGNNLVMLYRDNNSNIRDTWAGISTDGGNTFDGGMGVDQHNWMLPICTSTGPDGVIIGDTLYSVFMNGVSGTYLSYISAASVSGITGTTGTELTNAIPGLSLQTYPRIASDGTAMAVVWRQIVNGGEQCLMRFTNDIVNGLPMAYDTVDLDDILNADVALANGNVSVVWEDDNSGTVKFRSGSFNSTTGIHEAALMNNSFSVYPNPAASEFRIVSAGPPEDVKVFNVFGQVVFHSRPNERSVSVRPGAAGIYFVTVTLKNVILTKRIAIVQ